jgi:RNAse H-fold protein YqgF
MDLSKSERTLMVENFKLMLAKEINLPIIFQDERQTTINAENILQSAGYSKTKRKTKKDSLAAQLILEDYLASTYNKG